MFRPRVARLKLGVEICRGDACPGRGCSVPERPSVSLVVCSKDRAHKIARCLQAIVQIVATDNFEFILVDNGSTDDTKSIFDRATKFAPFPVRYIFEKTPGVGNAMNAGYRKSCGDIVAFTDDDCYPAPDFAAAVADAFADPAIGVATGRILLHDPMDLALTIETSSVPRRFRTGRYVRPGQFTGANLSFRRAALEAIGGIRSALWTGQLYWVGGRLRCSRARLLGGLGRHIRPPHRGEPSPRPHRR